MTSDVSPRWPRRSHPWTMTALFLSLVLTVFVVRFRVQHALPLQRLYFADYARVTLYHPAREEPFHVVYVGNQLADDAIFDQVPGRVTQPIEHWKPDEFRGFLRARIYYRESLWRWLLMAFLFSGLCSVPVLASGLCLDRIYNVQTRNGRRLRGPGLVSRWAFNKAVARAAR